MDALRIVDPVLTTIARGYRNAQMISESLFPVALMEKEGGKVPQFGKEAFRIYKTERAARADSNEAQPEGYTSIPVVLEEHDLAWPIDRREEQESMLNEEQAATRRVTDILALRREKIAADLAQNPDNYPDGNKTALSGGSQWSDPGSDPVADIEAGKEAIRSKIGIKPNTLVLGATAYKYLKSHGALLELIKYSQTGIVTVDLLKVIFDIKNIVVGEAVYADGNTFGDVWRDVAILAFVPPPPPATSGMTLNYEADPSFGYTLRKRDYPQVDRYTTNGGKVIKVRNTDIFKVQILGADAGYLISDVAADPKS